MSIALTAMAPKTVSKSTKQLTRCEVSVEQLGREPEDHEKREDDSQDWHRGPPGRQIAERRRRRFVALVFLRQNDLIEMSQILLQRGHGRVAFRRFPAQRAVDDRLERQRDLRPQTANEGRIRL